MAKVTDFQELARMSKTQLGSILDNETNAEMLWNFLHTDHTHAHRPRLSRLDEASSSKESFNSKKTHSRTAQGGKGRRQQKKL